MHMFPKVSACPRYVKKFLRCMCRCNVSCFPQKHINQHPQCCCVSILFPSLHQFFSVTSISLWGTSRSSSSHVYAALLVSAALMKPSLSVCISCLNPAQPRVWDLHPSTGVIHILIFVFPSLHLTTSVFPSLCVRVCVCSLSLLSH